MRDRKSDAHRKIANARPGEVVHHKDDNKENNDPRNLDKSMTARQHNKHTASQSKRLRSLKAALNMPARKEKLY
jgi:hypothetical protein